MRFDVLYALALGGLTFLPSYASATESALGRYIPGVFATPNAGIVPPVPGVYWQNSSFYYHGSADGSLEIPVGNSVRTGLESDFYSTTFTGLWVPELELGHGLTFALSASVPVQYLDISARLGPFETEDSSGSIGDIMIAPTLGWHSGTTFMSASLRIYAPTGAYDADALSNVGMNYWTFSPTFAFTHINPATGLEFDLLAGLDINTENQATDYTSGAMGHLDAVLIQNFSKQFGLGVFASVLYQLGDDKSTFADARDGFKGRSYAIGPILKYTAGTEAKPISMSLSWAPEFGTKNRLKGDGFYLNLSGSF
jgi:hypothetical protein